MMKKNRKIVLVVICVFVFFSVNVEASFVPYDTLEFGGKIETTKATSPPVFTPYDTLEFGGKIGVASYNYLGNIVNDTNIGSTFSNNERVFTRTSDGGLHVVYRVNDSGSVNIWYGYSIDDGLNWTNTKISTNATSDEYMPCILSDSNNNLHVIWVEGTSAIKKQLRYRNYSGGTWGTVENLTTNFSNTYYQPNMAIDSNNVIHLIYTSDENPYNVYYHLWYMNNTGGSWQPASQVINTSYGVSEPSIAVDYNDNLHVVCRNKTPVYEIIYINKTTSWGSLTTIAEKPSFLDWQTSPVIAIDKSNNIHVAWIGFEGALLENRNIRYCNHTSQWNTPINITSLSGSWSSLPFLSIDVNDTIHLVFYGNFTGTNTHYLRYLNLTDTGWTAIQNLTNYGNNQDHPHPICSTYPSFTMTDKGFAIVFVEENVSSHNINYFSSYDLDWPSATVSVFTAYDTLSFGGKATVSEGTIDIEVAPDTWDAGNPSCSSSTTENFTFYQNGSATIDTKIGFNKTNYTFVTYATWVGNGHDQYCANFTTDTWGSETNIAPKVGGAPVTTLKTSVNGNSDFGFGIRIYMPKTVSTANLREDFKVMFNATIS